MQCKTITLRIPQNVAQAIEARSEVTGKSKSRVILDRLTQLHEPPLPLIAPYPATQDQKLISVQLQFQIIRSREQRQILKQQQLELMQQSIRLQAQQSQLQKTVEHSKSLIAMQTLPLAPHKRGL